MVRVPILALDRVVSDLQQVGIVERNPILEGRFLTMIFSPDAVALRRAKKQQAPPAAKAPQPKDSDAQTQNA